MWNEKPMSENGLHKIPVMRTALEQIQELHKPKAPDTRALALAILEAAGYDDMADDANLADVHAFNAMHKLQESVDTQERATAEAKEQAELEAEALAFFNAYDNVPQKMSEPPLESFVGMPRYVKDRWLAVDRFIAKIRAEAKAEALNEMAHVLEADIPGHAHENCQIIAGRNIIRIIRDRANQYKESPNA